jgi:hypothetical protein
LRYIKAQIRAVGESRRMERDDNIDVVAKAMIRAFGERAAPIMRKRAADHQQAGEEEGARFWGCVERAIRRLEAEASLPSSREESPGPALSSGLRGR